MLMVLASGTYGFDTLTHGKNSLITCLYMTVLTVSTVGFSEIIPTVNDSLRLFTIGLILLGGGSILYFLTSVTAMVIEGDLAYRFWRRRMARQLESMHGHIIVAGLGRTGLRALEELWPARTPVIVIEDRTERIELAIRHFGESLLFVAGDALDEENLRTARIASARGVIACLHDDRENLFLCVTARQLNRRLRIVAKLSDSANAAKFKQVGADAAIDPAWIGGRRLANELFRPGLMAFTDAVLASESTRKSLLSIEIGSRSELTDAPLDSEELLSKTGCLVLGLRFGADGPYRYHPEEDAVLRAGSFVMALGYPRQLRKLKRLLNGAGQSRR